MPTGTETKCRPSVSSALCAYAARPHARTPAALRFCLASFALGRARHIEPTQATHNIRSPAPAHSPPTSLWRMAYACPSRQGRGQSAKVCPKIVF